MNFYYKRTSVKVKQEKITEALIRFAKVPPPPFFFLFFRLFLGVWMLLTFLDWRLSSSSLQLAAGHDVFALQTPCAVCSSGQITLCYR